MRIRKNAKLSPLLFSSSLSSSSSSCVLGGSSVPVETHVCQLNQSPWDVIPFDSDSIQFPLDDSFTAGYNNGSVENSLGAVESSTASMMYADRADHAMTVVDEVAPINMDVSRNMTNPCRFYDRDWPCKNEARQGQSFCEQHLSFSPPLLAPHYSSSSSKKSQPPSGGSSGTRRGKARVAAVGGRKAVGPSSNPYEFYYYSGFGPLWGKRRGEKYGGDGDGSRNNGTEDSTLVVAENVAAAVKDNGTRTEVGAASVAEMAHEGIIDFVDDDEEEEGTVDDSGKKRMRKPVKARSLKSLM